MFDRSSRGAAPGTNRYNGLLLKLMVALLVVLALPGVAILWGGRLAEALIIPATPAMIAHLLIALAFTAQRRGEVSKALTHLRSLPQTEQKVWRWTPVEWGSFAMGRRPGLGSAAAAMGGAHGAATLALIVIAWEERLRLLPWGAALSLSALAGLGIGGFYSALLLGRYSPVERTEPTEIVLTGRALYFNGDALALVSGTSAIAAIETRPGPPAWLVIHLQRPDRRIVRVALPVPAEEQKNLQETADWLDPTKQPEKSRP